MDWQQELRNNLTTADDLVRASLCAPEEAKQMEELVGQYPVSITRYYLGLIDRSDPGDPIRRMAAPSLCEWEPGGSSDTSGEAGNTVVEGLQHKYAQTAMMLSTNQCAMYCRHCFRKRLVGLTDEEVAKHFATMGEYIRAHREISNVLVSGGDALLNTNQRLDAILAMLTGIPHLDAVRICTRVPVVFPQRITGDSALLELLQRHNAQKQLVMVTQYNHPRELTEKSLAAVRLIQKLGIPVKNQAVLLRGVNDSAETLGTLLRGLVAAGIAPYYVFQCRPVTGVKSSFQVPLAEGVRIVEGAKAMQSGLGKAFRYCMSHVSGKLEILGVPREGEITFQYHEAADPALLGRLFTKPVAPQQTWLDAADPLFDAL